VAEEKQDPRSFLMLTRRLLELRRAIPALTLGSYQSIEQENDNCFVYLRQHDDQRYMVALNFSDQEQVVTVTGHIEGNIVISTFMDREGFIDLSKVHLRSNEGILINAGEL
jgi:alpha-glucosidase